MAEGLVKVAYPKCTPIERKPQGRCVYKGLGYGGTSGFFVGFNLYESVYPGTGGWLLDKTCVGVCIGDACLHVGYGCLPGSPAGVQPVLVKDEQNGDVYLQLVGADGQEVPAGWSAVNEDATIWLDLWERAG